MKIIYRRLRIKQPFELKVINYKFQDGPDHFHYWKFMLIHYCSKKKDLNWSLPPEEIIEETSTQS